MNKNTDLGLLILRIAVGGLMLLHGIAKFGHTEGIGGMLTEKGLPAFMSYGVYITEVIAPILILIGFRTRLASAVYVFGALFALFLAHSSELFELSEHGGWKLELLGLYISGALCLFFTGGGKLAASSSNQWD
ncbi:DoxX family protein [Flavobacterium flavipallidum]|uniref:DoxX family protein n=1 Tax=Flavobacterium flavipallidum TaxID=3139140 RepID=A0ABU9HM03_9FLAO